MEETSLHQPVADGGAPAVQPPWSPTGIAVLSVVVSPLLGGILHGLNYERLGRPELKRFALARNLLSATALLLFWNLDMPTSFASLFMAAYFYKTQEEPFLRAVPAGGRKASLFRPAVLFIALALALLVVYNAIFWLAS